MLPFNSSVDGHCSPMTCDPILQIRRLRLEHLVAHLQSCCHRQWRQKSGPRPIASSHMVSATWLLRQLTMESHSGESIIT
jgi:hypothetical protein